MKRQFSWLWIRQGDGGEYEKFDTISEVNLEDRDLGEFLGWREGRFFTSNFAGDNYVSLYWGDANANRVRWLSQREKAEVELAITEGRPK